MSNFAKNSFIPKDTRLESVNTVTRQLEYLNSAYPVNKLETITFSGRMSERTGAMACYSTLTVNKKIKEFGESVLLPKEWAETMKQKIDYFSKKKDLKKLKLYTDYAKYTRGNVCYKGLETETAIAHEYGHIIADQKTGQLNGYYANKNFERKDGNALYEKVKMIDNVYRQAKANGDIYKISVYAATKSEEFFAERNL